MRKLNNIEIPSPGFGRAFAFKEQGPHFAGPININGEIFAAKIWLNKTTQGREYLRIVLESPEESGLYIEE